jgi:hypothetical protein
MTTIVNLFSNFDDLNKTKSVVDSASKYKNNQTDVNNLSTSLNQGKKFKKYQKKIIKNLEKDIDNVNSKEGFVSSFDTSTLNTTKNGLTDKSNDLIKDNNYSSQQQTISNLQTLYQSTLNEYDTLIDKISSTTTNYFNRVGTTNPYLNKTVRFKSGELAYVTNQGVLKYIPSVDILNSTNAPKTFLEIDLSWNNSWSAPGATIGTIPPLVSGTPVQLNQSLGNEGLNVFVNSLINNPTSSYQGCYADNTSSPLMTFVGGAPSSDSSGSYTYGMCQQAAIDAGYTYFALQSVNLSTAKGYCAISNSQSTSTSLGESMVPNGQTALWSSSTGGQTGNTATLTNTGALSVIASSGQSIFSTPNSTAQPSNYLGCYEDKADRAMTMYNGGKQEYDLDQCQQAAASGGYQFFGLQYSTSGTNAQCALSNDFTQTTQYGKAGNCTQISDGTWSGGGWSNAVYNTTNPNSNYYLILQNDGNMCVYRGTGPTDNQGIIWSSNTNGQLQDSNPAYAAANGKYGKNWIASGSTLAAGDFVGSTSGNMALIMQSDGNLVLYTFNMISNCQKMSDGNMGAGAGGNALYNISQTSIPSNLFKLGYVDENSELRLYPSSNTQYSNTYTTLSGTDSVGNNISGGTSGNTTVSACQTSCNNNADCAGFSFSTSNNTCSLKNSSMYPNDKKQPNTNVDLYVRNEQPITPPRGISNVVKNIDTISYQNYIVGSNQTQNYGLSSATSAEKDKLSELETLMDQLSSQLNSLTGKFSNGSYDIQTQLQTNSQGMKDYAQGIVTANKKVTNFDTNVENMLKDSDIVVLQKNYNYLFWSILAVGTVLISMNIAKKGTS